MKGSKKLPPQDAAPKMNEDASYGKLAGGIITVANDEDTVYRPTVGISTVVSYVLTMVLFVTGVNYCLRSPQDTQPLVDLPIATGEIALHIVTLDGLAFAAVDSSILRVSLSEAKDLSREAQHLVELKRVTFKKRLVDPTGAVIEPAQADAVNQPTTEKLLQTDPEISIIDDGDQHAPFDSDKSYCGNDCRLSELLDQWERDDAQSLPRYGGRHMSPLAVCLDACFGSHFPCSPNCEKIVDAYRRNGRPLTNQYNQYQRQQYAQPLQTDPDNFVHFGSDEVDCGKYCRSGFGADRPYNLCFDNCEQERHAYRQRGLPMPEMIDRWKEGDETQLQQTGPEHHILDLDEGACEKDCGSFYGAGGPYNACFDDCEQQLQAVRRKGWTESRMNLVNQRKPDETQPLPKNGGPEFIVAPYCGSCFGAMADDECCNSCGEVVQAYRRKGWAMNPDDGDQCEREETQGAAADNTQHDDSLQTPLQTHSWRLVVVSARWRVVVTTPGTTLREVRPPKTSSWVPVSRRCLQDC